MKIARKALSSIVAAGTFAALAAQAGGTIVLEGYENGFTTNSQGVTNIAQFTAYGNLRNNTPVSVSIYTSAGLGDPRVTEGTHSAQIVFPSDGFGNDVGIALSDNACALLESAASSNQPARYIFRYDVILQDPGLISYFNQHFLIANEWDYVRSGGGIITNYGGHTFEIDSFSMPLDLVGIGMPTNPPSGMNSADFAYDAMVGLTAIFSDQFGAVTEPLTNFTIYIDNMRLIDTYDTPSDTPAVYPLQSFEGEGNLGGAVDLDSPATTLSLYTTNGEYDPTIGLPGVDALMNSKYVAPPAFGGTVLPDQESDFAATDGTNCLEVNVANPGYSQFIFSLPLAGTRLQQIINLNLTPAQLAHYAIRWDVTTPYVPVLNDGLVGDYFELDYNATTGSILPMSTGRRQSDAQYGLERETYSETLDQVLYWGTTPSLTFSCSIDNNWTNDPFYFDNFRILNTAPKYTQITAESYSAGTQKLTLTWLSEPSEKYTVQFSPTLGAAFNTVLATNLPSGGDFTTNTVTTPGGTAGYVRVLAQ